MRQRLRALWRRWTMFREALHGEIVFRRHRKGRCTWIEEPSHGSFRWRKCEYAFCDKREYMADTSARWTPVTSPVAQRRLTAAVARLRGQGVVGVSPVEARAREINDFYQRQLVNHIDGHQIIGYNIDDARAGDIAYWNAAGQIIVTRPEVDPIEATFTVRDQVAAEQGRFADWNEPPLQFHEIDLIDPVASDYVFRRLNGEAA